MKKKIFKKKIKYDNNENTNSSDMILTYELLEEHDVVKKAMELLPDLKKPSSDLYKYLNNLGSISDISAHELEEYIAVINHWQNYYGVKLKLASVIKDVALEQKKKFFSLAISKDNRKVNITEKKEKAFSDINHLKALEVYNEALIRYESISTIFDACERAYKAISRVVSIEEKLP